VIDTYYLRITKILCSDNLFMFIAISLYVAVVIATIMLIFVLDFEGQTKNYKDKYLE